MGSLSDFAENALLNHLANTAFTPAATLYVALCTALPTDASTGATIAEVANAAAYARTAVTFAAAASRKVIQTGPVTFPQATGPWGATDVTHWAIVDSATHGAGNMLAYGDFQPTFHPVNGNTPTIPSGELEVEIGRSHYTATTISATAPSTLSDSANNFPLFTVGQLIYISGFTGTPANNGTATVVSSTSSTIVISGITFVNDAAGESVRIASSGGFTDYLVHAWLNRMFRNQTAIPKPATYVALSTAVIEDNDVAIGDVTENTGTGYARVQVNPNGGASPTWTVAAAGAIENVQAITFPPPTGTWGAVTSMFLIDSPSGAGNVLGYDNESIVTQTPISGDTVQFPIGGLDLQIQ